MVIRSAALEIFPCYVRLQGIHTSGIIRKTAAKETGRCPLCFQAGGDFEVWLGSGALTVTAQTECEGERSLKQHKIRIPDTNIFLKRLMIYRGRYCIMNMVMRNEKIHFHA